MGPEQKGGVNHRASTRRCPPHFYQHIFTIHFATKAAITHTLARSRNYRSSERRFIKGRPPQPSGAAGGNSNDEKLFFLTRRVYRSLLEPSEAERGAAESGVMACREFSAHHNTAADDPASRGRGALSRMFSASPSALGGAVR